MELMKRDIRKVESMTLEGDTNCKKGDCNGGYWTLLRDYASGQTVIKLKLVKNSAVGTKRPSLPSLPPQQPIKRIKMLYSTSPDMPSLSTRISSLSSTVSPCLSSFEERSYTRPTTLSTDVQPTLPLKKRPRKSPSAPGRYREASIETLTRLDAILPSAQDRESHQVDDNSYMQYRNILLGALESEKFRLPQPVYELEGFVGCGASGLVVRARQNDRPVVIKMIADVSSSAHAKYHKELDNLLSLDHPNIIPLIDAFTCPSHHMRTNYSQDTPLKTPQIFCLVMPYMEETLFDLLARQRELRATKLGGLPLTTAQKIFAQIATGLAQMHAGGMSHNDIKEENTLISIKSDDQIQASLCDLGHARMTKTQKEPKVLSPQYKCDLVDCHHIAENVQDTRLYIIYGTAAMTPPEMQPNYRLRQKLLRTSSSSTATNPDFIKFHGFEADVYALGLVLHSMIFGKLPDECHTWPKTMEELKRLQPVKQPAGQCAVDIGGSNHLRLALPTALRQLLNGMLHRDLNQRLRMDQVIKHPWVRSAVPTS